MSRLLTRAPRSTTALVAMLVVFLAGAAPAPGVGASTTISANVPATTSIDLDACSMSGLGLGTTPLQTTAITSDCTVEFDASSGGSSLRVRQSDMTESAMAAHDPVWEVKSSSASIRGIAVNGGDVLMTGVAARTGDPSFVRTSADGGLTWTDRTVGGTATLYAADWTPSGNRAWVVGSSGTVRSSTDRGVTWSSQSPSTSVHLLSVSAADETTAWTVGYSGVIRKTTNGGASWSAQASGVTYHLRDVDALSPSIAWVVGNGPAGAPPTVLKTLDGGATWQSVTIPAASTNSLSSIDVIDANTVIAVGDYGTLRTTDAGATWTRLSTTALAVDAFDASTVAAVTYFGIARMSADGGVSWTAQNTGVPVHLLAVGWINATTLLAAGHGDTLVRSTDAGATWAPVGTPSPSYRGAATFGRHAWVVGDDGVALHSHDAGDTWAASTSNTTQRLTEVDASSESVVWAVGAAGTVLRSTDGGATYTPRPTGYGGSFNDVAAMDDDTAIAIGNGGIIRVTRDGGATWTAATSGTTSELVAIDQADARIVYAVGYGQTVLRSTDAGATWQAVSTPSGEVFLAVDVAPDGSIWIGGSVPAGQTEGTLLRSTDGGATFTQHAAGVTTSIGDVAAANAQVAWVETRRTWDGGATFSSETIGAGFGVEGLAVIDDTRVIGVSASRYIGRARPLAQLPDFATPTNDFSSATGAFGACLHTLASASASAWPVAGSGNCVATNSGVWRGIPSSTPATIAVSTGPAAGQASLRFGMRPASNQPPGRYTAAVDFEVLATG